MRRRLGAGGFATVWLAHDDQLDSPVAVKVLADNWTEDAHVRSRFLGEGRLLRRVESAHVVPVYDAGELDDGRPYLVMAYADQGTLADRLDGGAPMASDEAAAVIRQIGAGLTALHELDVLHRDVKPANVLFRTVHGRVQAMLGDLGLGKTLDVSSRLTLVAGTPSYVAPEQARGDRLDPRADQFALACLSYLLITGRPPYVHATLSAAAKGLPPAPMTVNGAAVPSSVQAVVSRGLAADREQRFPTVAAFVAALDAALSDLPGHGSRPDAWLPVDPELTQPGNRPPAPNQDPTKASASRPPRGRARVVTALAAALALGLGVAGGVAAYRTTRPAQVTVQDANSSLEITVPRAWTRAINPDGWTPPEAERASSGLSAGTAVGWQTAPDGYGAFVGLLPGKSLPSLLPGHPECADDLGVVLDEYEGDRMRTETFVGCPEGVLVERVIKVTSNELVWFQVKAPDRSTANRVLDSLVTRGL